MEYLSKAQMDSLDLNSLSEEKRTKIIELKNSIRTDDESILDFGSSATKNLSDFSTSMLKTIRLKDFPEIDTIISHLMTELQKVDSNTLLSYKPSSWKKFLRLDNLEKFLKDFTSQFENVSDVIKDIKDKLEDAKYQLKKDISLCEQYREQNLQYINELDNCIFAGRLKLKELEEEIQNEMKTLDKNDVLAVHMVNMKQNALTELETNVRDLILIRTDAVQNMNRLSLIKAGDTALIKKINSSINMAIPLWESQMLVAFIIARQQSCINLEKAISETTNNLISMNSELVKVGAVQIAQELQRGIIDPEVLKTSTQKLIETFNEVKKINLEGQKKRKEVIKEIGAVTLGLSEAILLEEKGH